MSALLGSLLLRQKSTKEVQMGSGSRVRRLSESILGGVTQAKAETLGRGLAYLEN